jgi:hypothetical protein
MLNLQMRLITKSSANYYYKNLLTSNKVIAIILDKYINASCYNLILIVREASRERPQMRIINITHAIYICLYTISYSSYIATIASIIVYSYKTIIGPISKRGLSSKSFTSITFTFIKSSYHSFILATFYSNILLTRTSLARQ